LVIFALIAISLAITNLIELQIIKDIIVIFKYLGLINTMVKLNFTVINFIIWQLKVKFLKANCF